jgi:hypothetical protein
MRSSSLRNEEGATLVIVLMFISVFGLILAGLLTEAGASVKYTNTVIGHEEKVYAADAGVAFGIQQLQHNNQLCPNTAPEQPLQVITVNGLDTQVTCEVTSGSTQGVRGLSIITRSPAANSLTVQSGGPKTVTGPVFVTGDVDGWNTGLVVKAGNFAQQRGNGCTTAAPPTTDLKLDPGHSYSCGTAVPPDPGYAVPARPTGTPPLRPATTSGTCKIFYPGLYTSAPVLSGGTNYFASGVYYFNFAGVFNVTETVYGGDPTTPTSDEVEYGPIPGCASDSTAVTAAGGSAPELSGSGVEFIFGGGASMNAGNGSRVELFTRTLDRTIATTDATFVAVPSSPPTNAWTAAGWVANPPNTRVLDFSNGSNPDLVIHGVIYAPDKNIRLWSTNSVDASVMGGILAWKLELQSAACGPAATPCGLAVSARNGNPHPRHVIIRATAPYPAPAGGEKQVVSTAVIQVANNAFGSVTVGSWRTRGPTDSL